MADLVQRGEKELGIVYPRGQRRFGSNVGPAGAGAQTMLREVEIQVGVLLLGQQVLVRGSAQRLGRPRTERESG